MRYEASDLKRDLDSLGIVRSVRLLWLIIRIVKHGRLRCRNNKALYNWVRGAFPEFSYRTETRIGFRGKSYEALIVTDASGVVETELENEDE